MKTKIINYQLLTLFVLSLNAWIIFGMGAHLPDNYLSINSANTHSIIVGFISYYFVSLLTFVNYYSGMWIILPFIMLAASQFFIINKRADWLDTSAFFSLSVSMLSLIFFLKPTLIGMGLYQNINEIFSATGIFFTFVFATGAFLYTLFRKQLVTSVQESAQLMYIESKKFVEKHKVMLPETTIAIHKEEVIASEKIVEEEPELEEELEGELEVELEAETEVEVEVEPEIETTRPSPLNQGQGYNESHYFNILHSSFMTTPDEHRHVSHPDDRYFQDIINKIQTKLGEFKIQGKIINILKGPVVDTFEWELGTGEKVSRLTVTAEDLSLALSGAPIRMVYPLKGRTTVGIEVPRNPRDFIYLEDLVSSREFKDTIHQLPLAMGKDAFGVPVVVDLAAMPHMLVAGSTGAGKSVFINSILVSLLIKKSPAKMKLILIDPKQLELALYARLPHLIMPVITESKTAATALLWACEEMERRYSIMSEFGVRNIEGFNHKLKRADAAHLDSIRKFYDEADFELPFIVIIVDEFADLILTSSGKDIEKNICRLAAKARASGIHLILATQRPSVDVITGLIKSNFPTRVSFRVTSSTDSRTILNAMGAEKLLGKGDMLYKYGVETTRVHSAFIDETEIETIADKLSEMPAAFSDAVLEFLENGGEVDFESRQIESGESNSGGRDEKYEEAVKVVLEHRSASASLLQRRLGVGYNRAANLIDEMEASGIVGPAQGSKPRKVLGSGLEINP